MIFSMRLIKIIDRQRRCGIALELCYFGPFQTPMDLMKPAGFLLLISGWLLVLAALAMLKDGAARVAFIVAALAVEALGLVLAVRSHLSPPRTDRH